MLPASVAHATGIGSLGGTVLGSNYVGVGGVTVTLDDATTLASSGISTRRTLPAPGSSTRSPRRLPRPLPGRSRFAPDLAHRVRSAVPVLTQFTTLHVISSYSCRQREHPRSFHARRSHLPALLPATPSHAVRLRDCQRRRVTSAHVPHVFVSSYTPLVRHTCWQHAPSWPRRHHPTPPTTSHRHAPACRNPRSSASRHTGCRSPQQSASPRSCVVRASPPPQRCTDAEVRSVSLADVVARASPRSLNYVSRFAYATTARRPSSPLSRARPSPPLPSGSPRRTITGIVRDKATGRLSRNSRLDRPPHRERGRTAPAASPPPADATALHDPRLHARVQDPVVARSWSVPSLPRVTSYRQPQQRLGRERHQRHH